MLASTGAPWFNWIYHDMSDIGASSDGLLFNTSMIIAGITSIILSVGIYKWIGTKRIATFGLVVMIIGFFSLTLLGFITRMFGMVHYILAVMYYLSVSLGIFLYGIAIFKNGLFVHGAISCTTSIAAIASVLFIPHQGAAVPEVIGTILFGYWAFYMTLNLLFSERL